MSVIGATRPTSALSTSMWVELFPWLDDYVSDRAAHLERLAEPSDWWLADSPAVTASETDVEAILKALADLFVAHHKVLVLSDAFPKVPVAFPVVALDAGPVATTTIHRAANADTVTRLLQLTAGELFAVRGTGEETVADVVRALLRISVRADPWQGVEVAEVGEGNPALDQLLGDLTALAQWRQVRGLRTRPLLAVALDDESPAAIQEIANRITAITPEDFPEGNIGDPVAEVERLIATFNEAESTVLERRLLACEPETLGRVALGLHVSKGRASGIESGMKRKFLAACDFGTATGTLLASIRMDMRPVAHLDRLIERHPELAAPVSTSGVPLWLALDRFDDIFEVTDGWAAAPDVRVAKQRTVDLLAELADEAGPASAGDLAAVFGMPVAECTAWLQWCALPIPTVDHVGPDGVHPEHTELVHPDLDPAGVDYAGSRQPTIARSADEYSAPAVDSSNRLPAPQETPILAPIERYDAPGADRPFPAPAPTATSRPTSGIGSAPTEDSPTETPPTRTPPTRRRERRPAAPERTRGLYRSSEGWRYRLVLTLDHLRGSGFAIPGGVAAAVGCPPGAAVSLDSRLGPQAVRFTGMQPTCGTIRRFLAELDSDPGDVVFLYFGDDGSFDVQPAPRVTRAGRPLDQALATIGRTTPITGRAAGLRLLAAAILLPEDAALQQIMNAYRNRANDPVLEYIETVCAVEDYAG